MGFIATFLTKPTDINILKTFYNKVNPDGNWSIVKNREKSKQHKKYISTIYILGKYYYTALFNLFAFL